MENPSPPRHHRLAWLALATFGTLLLLPGTRYLLKTQMRMQTLTYSTTTDFSQERAAAARLASDYPVQLALATRLPSDSNGTGYDPLHPLEQSKARNRRIAALEQQFPNNPSVYANLMRYMSLGEMRLMRDPKPADTSTAANVQVYVPSEETQEMFLAAAQKGAALDPDNAYFPMMETVGLLAAHRDREAMDALKIAGRCSQWKEYFQDDLDGQNRLRSATYGEQGAVQHLYTAASLLFPQYASLRSAAQVAARLAAEEERDGNTAEGIEIRHALMRCGGLMRSQGAFQITVLVGVAITTLGTVNPGGVSEADNQSLTSYPVKSDDAEKLRAERLTKYCAYLETLGQTQEAAWAKTEAGAGAQARAIGMEAMSLSVFDGMNFFQLGVAWLVNNSLLSGVLILLVLGAAANLAGHIRPRKGLKLGRFLYAVAILGGIALWQWQASRVCSSPFVEIQNLFRDVSSSNNYDGEANAAAIQRLAAGLGLLIPQLLVGLIAVLSLFQKVPVSTGLGRGLRGIAIPMAAVLFLVYGVSLLPTASLEASINTDITRTANNEPHRFAELTGKVWPGDPQP